MGVLKTPAIVFGGSGNVYADNTVGFAPHTARARPGRSRGLGASHSISGFVWRFCMGTQGA